jgi:hypothetical protein
MHALPDHAALKLGERDRHLEHQAPSGCGRVDERWSRYRSTPLASSVWIVPSRSISERPRGSIAPGHEYIELAPLVEARSVIERQRFSALGFEGISVHGE